MKKPNRKANRLERADQKRKAVAYHQAGTGMYLFKNRSSVASLELPKPSADGKRWVEPGQTWKGDSYFLGMVPGDAILVECLTEQKKEDGKMPEKLILDQPDQVTSAGKVEHSVVQEDLPINEVSPHEAKAKERLLTEDPLAGVTIIRD
jgi:hypothetical protein